MNNYLNLIILITIIVITSVFSIDIREPYPKQIIELFSFPLTRFILYFTLYIISLYSLKIGLSLLIMILLLHMDYIELLK